LGKESAEELHKRHVANFKRVEKAVENLTGRVTRTEEAVVPPAGHVSEGAPVLRDIQELHRRMHLLEERQDDSDAESLRNTQVAICDVVLQVSELTQQFKKSDRQLAVLQERLDQVSHSAVSKHVNDDVFSRIVRSGTKSSGQVSQEIRHLMDHLHEFESECKDDEARLHGICRQSMPVARWDFCEDFETGLVGTHGAAVGTEKVDKALQRLQGMCLKASDDLANSVRQELLELQETQDLSWECPSIGPQAGSVLDSCRSGSEDCSRHSTP